MYHADRIVSSTPPETIAHYRISSKLGEGAMGEVYRATERKLGREVAIKLIPEDFARDSQRMARFMREAQVLASLNAMPVNPDAAGHRTAVPVVQSPAGELGAYVSPDNRWIAYMSNETGRQEIFVQPFAAGGNKMTGKWMVSRGTLGMARWRSDSKELMFVGLEGDVVTVDVAPGAAFQASAPKNCFRCHSIC